MEYILSKKEKTCIFCEKNIDPARDEELGVLYRGNTCFVVMNLYPYNNGHIMVSPYRHTDSLTQFSPEELEECFKLVAISEGILMRTFNTQGINVGINIGEASGAGYKEHLHVHLVPRWVGDTNFMCTMTETRLLPETVEESYQRLKPEFDKLDIDG